MDITCIGCLHGRYPELDGGDLLIVTGDLTAIDEFSEYIYFRSWLATQKYRKKIVIAGNHDNKLHLDYKFGATPFLEIADYLCDSGTEFEGLKIWGFPWSRRFFRMNPKCMAFTYFDEAWLSDEKLSLIPHDIDILITHAPALGILDELSTGERVGSRALYAWLKYVGRPKLHVFSHIHEAYGQAEVLEGNNDTMVKSINCSHVNERYQPVNKPIRVQIGMSKNEKL